METAQGKNSPHPMILAAAASVIVFSVIGTAAVMGWIPKGSTQSTGQDATSTLPGAAATAPQGSVAANTPVVAAAPIAAAPVAAAKPAEAAKPVVRATPRAEPKPAPRTEPRVAMNEPVAAVPPPPAPVETRRNEPDGVISSAPPITATEIARPTPVICKDCGVIEAVNEIEKAGEGSGVGAVAGGVIGAVASKQVGGGRGRTAMSVLGAIGGAYAGHQIEKNQRAVKSYDITVRFEDGTTRTLSQPTPPSWRAGDRVRIVNGVLQSNA